MTMSVSQNLRLDQSSKIDPLTLLEKITRNGISQDVCVNDLGMKSRTFYIAILFFLKFCHPMFSETPMYITITWKENRWSCPLKCIILKYQVMSFIRKKCVLQIRNK